MTPREVQLSIKAASERRLDHYDELVAAAWQGALWARVDAKHFPKIEKVLTRRHQRRRPMTAEEDIARWERFFQRSDRQRGGRAN